MSARRRRIRIARLERKGAGGPTGRRRSPAEDGENAQSAAAEARQAASLAESAAQALHEAAEPEDQPAGAEIAQFPGSADLSTAEPSPARSEIVEHAAVLVEEAAAMVEHAARVVEATDPAERGAAPVPPRVERRSRPRGARRHEARVHWNHVAIYVPVLIAVVVVGALAIWSFVEKQSMAVAPSPLPPVTIITANPQSRLAAAWARFLTTAELAPTVVSVGQFRDVPAGGIVALCDVPSLPPQVAQSLAAAVSRGHALAILGAPPSTAVAGMTLSADAGLSDNGATISTADSPLLARAQPGFAILTRPVPVAFLRESSGMKVDARWSGSARAAIVHLNSGGTRVVWCGIDPDALRGDEPEFQLVMRTAFRWLAGQPISTAAAGPSAAQAETFSPAVRAAARTDGLAFSADSLLGARSLSVTIANRGKGRIDNPAVKVWLPRDVVRCGIGGDLFMRRAVTATYLSEDEACIVALPLLRPGQERVVKVTTIRK